MNEWLREIEAEMIYNVEPVDYSKLEIRVATYTWEQMQTTMTLRERKSTKKDINVLLVPERLYMCACSRTQ
jgi:hypothetical protein